MNCPYCNSPIPFNATQCPGCGAQVQQQAPPPQNAPQTPPPANAVSTKKDGLWMSIVSLACGVWALLAALDDGEWERDSVVGFIVLVAAALSNGIPAVAKKKALYGMGIAGIATAVVAVLCAL